MKIRENKAFEVTGEFKLHWTGKKLFKFNLAIDVSWGKKGKHCGWISEESEVKDEFLKNGEFHDGEFLGGVFRGGVFRGGEFRGGVFHDGVFRGGEFLGGEFLGGVFRGGVFRGGVFRGGVFRGGVFRGGVFLGGEFLGGEFLGGEFLGGEFLKSPFFIQGSKHFVCLIGDILNIGCQKHSIKYWIENFKTIGLHQGYTESEIKEYKMYIDLALKISKIK